MFGKQWGKLFILHWVLRINWTSTSDLTNSLTISFAEISDIVILSKYSKFINYFTMFWKRDYIRKHLNFCPNIRTRRHYKIRCTSYLNCSSLIILYVRESTKVNKSSLFPTAMVLPLGLHLMLIFSPLVVTVCVLLLANKK